jgi:hypothetical protein
MRKFVANRVVLGLGMLIEKYWKDIMGTYEPYYLYCVCNHIDYPRCNILIQE